MSDDAAGKLAQALASRGERLVTAESCTAGLVASTLASSSGASAYLWGGFICYSNEAKTDMLDVDPDLLAEKGAVSRDVALAMAEGALFVSGADLSVAVTGIAGPDGDGSSVPVGTVWIATAHNGSETRAVVRHYDGDRNAVREAAARDAIADLAQRLAEDGGIL